mgnify:CR=1 FL=1
MLFSDHIATDFLQVLLFVTLLGTWVVDARVELAAVLLEAACALTCLSWHGAKVPGGSPHPAALLAGRALVPLVNLSLAYAAGRWRPGGLGTGRRGGGSALALDKCISMRASGAAGGSSSKGKGKGEDMGAGPVEECAGDGDMSLGLSLMPPAEQGAAAGTGHDWSRHKVKSEAAVSHKDRADGDEGICLALTEEADTHGAAAAPEGSTCTRTRSNTAELQLLSLPSGLLLQGGSTSNTETIGQHTQPSQAQCQSLPWDAQSLGAGGEAAAAGTHSSSACGTTDGVHAAVGPQADSSTSTSSTSTSSRRQAQGRPSYALLRAPPYRAFVRHVTTYHKVRLRTLGR